MCDERVKGAGGGSDSRDDKVRVVVEKERETSQSSGRRKKGEGGGQEETKDHSSLLYLRFRASHSRGDDDEDAAPLTQLSGPSPHGLHHWDSSVWSLDSQQEQRTAEIERRRQSMGWSSATGEGKTAVAPSNLSGGDIWCETRETCMEAAKAEGVGWGGGGSTIPGAALPGLGYKVKTLVSPSDVIIPEKTRSKRLLSQNRSAQLSFGHQLTYFEPLLLRLAQDSERFSHFIALDEVRRQNMKVRIHATGDTIIMKFLRPNADTKLEGYILGYGGSMFSKQFIQLPENGQPIDNEFDAEPKYLIAVQPIPTNEVKKQCTGKVDLEKPLHIVIGSVTPTSVLLSWGTLLKTPYEGNIMNDCLEDGHYTVRYRERNRKWNYQTCPTSDTVIDNLKPNTVYEFGVQPSSKDATGVWSKPVIHNISMGGIEVLQNKTQGRLPVSRNIASKTTLGNHFSDLKQSSATTQEEDSPDLS
ncbi:hypothetical protein INR49_010236 [Caranx melampygus]|nr:hypothetical protein INR49_010236 [Caranx melampygus]